MKTPLVMKFPMFDFSSNYAMEEELEQNEICVARIPNTTNLGYTHHVAIVYKDDMGDVYSVAMNQHKGVLKDTKENADAISIEVSNEVPVQERTSSSKEVRTGEQSTGSEHSESTREKGINGTNEEQPLNTPRSDFKGRKPVEGT